MCGGIICKQCVYQELTTELGSEAANNIQSTFETWIKSCPEEDVMSLGTMIPMYINLLQIELQFYFLFTISLNFDPLTLSEWGIE
jgi:hypothetical protein